ncbi:MAG TPA: hypothetical protein PKG56_08265 [Chitinophagaceae bacterium]|nr:hypothetical protein [Chitinophagaceae bacterium]HNJ57838.1 hypothetical protein [Chitinophagaceae bacterium]HNL83372.1 hypothetical protein [Chitinophagaceae bacterium]HNM33481.1 hypothetical protein [Chitinophagaceae bacterium]
MKYHVPYNFILNYLYPLRPTIKKMLGGYTLQLNKKIFFFLRESDTNPEFNGVFVACIAEFFEELQAEIHTSKMEFDLDGSINSWIFISEDLPDFEQKVLIACNLIKDGDVRMGKI